MLPDLPWLPHLQELKLQDNELTGVLPLLSSPQLTALNLSFNSIADLDSIAAISLCTSLRSLSLHDNPAIELPGYADMRLQVCSSAAQPVQCCPMGLVEGQADKLAKCLREPWYDDAWPELDNTGPSAGILRACSLVRVNAARLRLCSDANHILSQNRQWSVGEHVLLAC